MISRPYYFFTIFFMFSSLLFSQQVEGEWKTIDDDTGDAKSIVEIYEEDGKLFGKVKKILREDKRDVRCTECDGDEKDQKVEGMVILKNFTEDGDKFVDGTILDPENGKTYDAKLWLKEDDTDKLKVRGYVSVFYRTQEWKRVED